MATESLVIGIAHDDRTERLTVEAERTEWTHDGTLYIYDDGDLVAEFPNASYAVRDDNVER